MSFTDFEVHQLKQHVFRMKSRINNNRKVNTAIKGDKKIKEVVISVKAVYAKKMQNKIIVQVDGEVCLDVKAIYCKAEMKKVVKVFISAEGVPSFKILKRKVANKPVSTPRSVRKINKENRIVNKILGDIPPMDNEDIMDYGVQQVLKTISRRDHTAQIAAANKYQRDITKGLKQLEKARRRLEQKARAFDKAKKMLQTA